MLIVLMSLTGCSAKSLSCHIEVPDEWRNPPYKEPQIGYVEYQGSYIIAKEEAKLLLMNQAICEGTRRGLVEIIDNTK